MIQRVADKEEKPISGQNPDELFRIYDKLKPSSQEEKPKDKNGILEDEDGDQLPAAKTGPSGRPTPEIVRIPQDKMTIYNQKIEAKFNETPENIMIDALAGTGKTTMLKHLSSFIKPGEKWLYLVFNKKNQVEGSKAFPAGVDVLTTHAFLGQLLKNSGKEVGGGTDLPPQGQKWRKIGRIADHVMSLDWPSVDSYLNYRNRKTGEWTSPFHWKAKNFTTKLADLGKAYAINPTQPDAADKLKEIIKQHGMDSDISTDKTPQDKDYTSDMIEMSLKIMQMTMPGGLPRNDELHNVRDQDDTLWYAALNADNIRWNPNGYKVVLMDEVQDFNECQLIMAQKLKEAGCRVIGVGDPHQAMYGFRGANAKAFDKLKDIIGSGQSQNLPINFRSGGNIIDWVKNNTHVSNLQAAPHLLGKGQVFADGGTNPPIKYNDFINNITDEFTKNRKLSEPTAIIARTNAPLGHAALNFLKNNVDFQIIGKDLSRNLVDLIKRVTKSKPEYVDIRNFGHDLTSFINDLEDKWSNKISKSDELKDLREFSQVLLSVLDYLRQKDYKEDERSRQLKTAKDFQIYLERKLGGLDPDNESDAAKLKSQDPRKIVTLTTAHKSKGLEWDKVFLMKPSEYNPERPSVKTEEQAQQEMNAWYVAATRGRNTLMVSADDEP
jgi:superfamily I DNA/RNA helicase